MASAGWPNWTGSALDLDRAAGGPDRARRARRTARPAPAPRARRRPAPRRRWRSKETSSSFVPTRRLRTLTRGRRVRAARSRSCARRARRHAGPSRSRAPSISSTIRSSAPGAMSTTPTVSPSRSTVARSQSAEISSSRCEMKITERPVWLCRLHDVENPLGEVGRQRRGHLVEQQHVGLDRQRAREIEDAQDGERDVPRRLAEIEIGNAELLDPAQERLDRRSGEAQIGGDVEVGDQRRLLVDRHQPGAARLGGRMHVARLAADQDSPGVRPDGAGQDLHQRRFAGAVRAHQRVDLAGPHRQRGVAQRRDRAVVLRDAGGFQEQLVGHCAIRRQPRTRVVRSEDARTLRAPGPRVPLLRPDASVGHRYDYSPGPLQAMICSLV